MLTAYSGRAPVRTSFGLTVNFPALLRVYPLALAVDEMRLLALSSKFAVALRRRKFLTGPPIQLSSGRVHFFGLGAGNRPI